MNQFVWIDLGVKNLDRAVKFYEKVLASSIAIESYEEFKFAVLPHKGNEVGGCLVPKVNFTPLSDSTLIYLNVDHRIKDACEQVEQNGGKLLTPPHSIGPHGCRAIILDSEGNTIALHSTEVISKNE
ncbi:MAG: VOC family protein [Gammaproteobacteria bacterium]|nr:VOC family protein [Gammaproteobacteria bacterium]